MPQRFLLAARMAAYADFEMISAGFHDAPPYTPYSPQAIYGARRSLYDGLTTRDVFIYFCRLRLHAGDDARCDAGDAMGFKYLNRRCEGRPPSARRCRSAKPARVLSPFQLSSAYSFRRQRF